MDDDGKLFLGAMICISVLAVVGAILVAILA